MKKLLTTMLLLLILWPPAANAGVPAFVTYSGRLTDGTGWGESTAQTLVFHLYDSASAAEPFWTTTHPDLAVVDGYFTVNLGMCNGDGTSCTVNPADATFPGDLPDQLWVGVVVDGVELGRQPVGSTPYALEAGRVGTITSGKVAGDLVVDGVLQLDGRPHCTVDALDFYVSMAGDDDTGDGTEQEPWHSIQRALDAVPTRIGHDVTIHVSAGTYYEHIIITGFSGGEGTLWIVGDEDAPDEHVLQVPEGTNSAFSIYGMLPSVYIKGFRIVSPNMEAKYGVVLRNSLYVCVSFCQFEGFKLSSGSTGYGLHAHGTNVMISNVEFTENDTPGGFSFSRVVVENCSGLNNVTSIVARSGSIVSTLQGNPGLSFSCAQGGMVNSETGILCP